MRMPCLRRITRQRQAHPRRRAHPARRVSITRITPSMQCLTRMQGTRRMKRMKRQAMHGTVPCPRVDTRSTWQHPRRSTWLHPRRNTAQTKHTSNRHTPTMPSRIAATEPLATAAASFRLRCHSPAAWRCIHRRPCPCTPPLRATLLPRAVRRRSGHRPPELPVVALIRAGAACA